MKILNINEIPSLFDKERYILESIDENNIDVCFEYVSDFSNSVILRSFISIICNKIGIKGIWKSRLILIIDELNNNAVEYGSKSDDINFMRFSIINEGRGNLTIKVEVEDTGRSNFSKKASDMLKIRKNKSLGNRVRSNPIRGRGLFVIIDKVVDELYFKDSSSGGLIVGVIKRISLS